jgi:hypothetical protein
MKAQFELDLTNALLPDWWPTGIPKVLPVEKGRYKKDFDLCREKIAPDDYRQLLEATDYANVGRDSGIPIGLDFIHIPIGAVIRRTR